MIEDEHILVERAQGGESDAFGLLYDYYMPKIYRFVLIKVGSREEAEDLVHQTFLKAWSNIARYESRGHPFSSWLYKIARNAVIDHHRKSKPIISIDSVSPDLLVEEQTQSGLLSSQMQWETLLIAMGDLKEIERDVLIMRFVDQLSHREISKVVSKTEGAVKVIQHRALKNLKILLKDND